MSPQQWKAKNLCEAIVDLSKCPLVTDETLVLCLAYTSAGGVSTVDNYKLSMSVGAFTRKLTALRNVNYLEITEHVKIAGTKRYIYRITPKGRKLLESTTLK